MKEKLVVGNLKMNLTSKEEREKYLEELKRETGILSQKKNKVVFCVPSIHLEAFKEAGIDNISMGAQNIFWENKGSFTGEISAPMVKNLGAEYVIIGHSERRKYFHETNTEANLKIKAAVNNGLLPIYCVGETTEQRSNGETAEVIIQQITEAIAGLLAEQVSKIVVAYEPVWAVGSDQLPTSDEILQIKILLKKIFTEKYGTNTAEKIKILYGGSVKANLVKQVCIDPAMDGVLVGRESLVPKDFMEIVCALK